MSHDKECCCNQCMLENELEMLYDGNCLWIECKNQLPLDEYEGQRVIDDFLVSLQPKDPMDDPEVTVLRFDAFTMTWRYKFLENKKWAHDSYHIIAWQPMPKPFKPNFYTLEDTEDTIIFCKKCHIELKPGLAIENTYIVGIPDFLGQDPKDMRGQTVSPGGSGKLIDVLKCPKCGYSVTK